jgi:DNA-directed RNA polymerase subunit RPC12/RpoP
MVVYKLLTFLQTMAFVCSTCGKAYSTNQNLARHSEKHQDPKACHCGKVFSTSEGLIEHKRAKHEFRYSCTECPNQVIFASKSGLLGHTRKYHSSVFNVENEYS